MGQSWLRYGCLGLLGMGLLGTGLWVGRVLWYRYRLDVAIAPLPQDAQIQVYFNYSQANHYQEPYRQQQRPGDNLEQVILDTISRAQTSIDVAIQEINLPRIAQALVAKQQAGVRVRVIVEDDYRRPWSQWSRAEIEELSERDRHKYDEFLHLADLDHDGEVQSHEALQRDARWILELGQIPLIDDTADGSKGSGLMHHKFIVVDNQILLTGSANFTISGIHGDFNHPDSLGNANHLVVIHNEAIAQHVTAEFQLMWGDGPKGKDDSVFGLQKPYRPPQSVQLSPDSVVTLKFSPVSGDRYSWEKTANGFIGTTLDTAQSTIDLALFVFSDQQLSQELYQKFQQGLSIRTLIDANFIYRSYSEALDMMGIIRPNHQCQYGDDHPWVPPLTSVGTPQLAEGDKLHHKFALIDQASVITGSQNWSESANHRNDEMVIVIQNRTVSAHFSREFERLYGNANLGIPNWLQNDVRDHQKRCPDG